MCPVGHKTLHSHSLTLELTIHLSDSALPKQQFLNRSSNVPKTQKESYLGQFDKKTSMPNGVRHDQL